MTVGELKALLGRAGLEIAKPWWTEGPLEPRAAWRRITSGETAPTVTVRGEERAGIGFPFDARTMSHDLDPVTALHDGPDAMRRLAVSAHPVVRRGVARARRLPADLVERPARDEDRVVHLFLAGSCDDAPADLPMKDTAEQAARHPGLPVPVMRRMPDPVGTGGAG
ncbi:hypothetical protein [Streptomyces sp. NPDC002588]|uniref:hypothetical protein n=1 Tax=Streptomyces sp. NPDC002588 TaxID=3154419 RepID=UPI00332DA36F